MSGSNCYSEIQLHFVWHTKESAPLLTPEVETFTYNYLRQRLVKTRGVYVHEIGGTENHIHLAVRIPPTLLISSSDQRVRRPTQGLIVP